VLVKFLFIFSLNLLLILPIQAIELDQLIELAQTRSEDILLKLTQEKISELELKKVRAQILPNISFKHDYTKQDDGGNPFIQTNQRTTNIQVLQPLYGGLREIRALKMANLGLTIAKLSKKLTDLEVAKIVADSYFDLLHNQKQLRLNQELLNLSRERVDFMQKRVKIGRSRQSELLSARSQVLTVESQIEALELEGKNLWQRIYTLLSVEPFALNEINLNMTLKNRQDYLSILTQHPWQQVLNFQMEQAREKISFDKGAHQPTVDLRGNYYFQRDGVFNQADWDFSINLNIPIYEGGATVNAVKQSMTELKILELEKNKKMRELEEEFAFYFDQVQKSKTQLKKMDEIVNLSQKNYQLQRQEYNLGLVNNLEVLQSLNQYIQSKKEYATLYYHTLKAYKKLMILTGVES
jgi:outer membrane protein TolC